MKRRVKGKRFFVSSRLTSSQRVRNVESLESRHCCSADESLMSVSLESALDVAEISYQPDVQATKETSEQPFVQQESIDPNQRKPLTIEDTVSVFDGIILESSIDECSKGADAGSIESESDGDGDGDGDGVGVGVGVGVGADAGSIRHDESGEGCTKINFPTGPGGFFEDQSMSSSNEGKGGMLPNSFSAAPAVSTNSSNLSDLRPQLLPIDKLSIGRLAIAIPTVVQSSSGPPNSVQSPSNSAQSIVPMQIIEVSPADGVEHGSKTARNLAEAIHAAMPRGSLREEFDLIQPVVAMLNAVESHSSVRRLSRIFRDIRPQVVEVPRIMSENLDTLLPTVRETNANAGSDTNNSKKQANERPVVKPIIKATKKSGTQPGSELGIASPSDPIEPLGRRKQLIFGAIVSGLIVFPHRVRDRLWNRIARNKSAIQRPLGLGKADE